MEQIVLGADVDLPYYRYQGQLWYLTNFADARQLIIADIKPLFGLPYFDQAFFIIQNRRGQRIKTYLGVKLESKLVALHKFGPLAELDPELQEQLKTYYLFHYLVRIENDGQFYVTDDAELITFDYKRVQKVKPYDYGWYLAGQKCHLTVSKSVLKRDDVLIIDPEAQFRTILGKLSINRLKVWRHKLICAIAQIDPEGVNLTNEICQRIVQLVNFRSLGQVSPTLPEPDRTMKIYQQDGVRWVKLNDNGRLWEFSEQGQVLLNSEDCLIEVEITGRGCYPKVPTLGRIDRVIWAMFHGYLRIPEGFEISALDKNPRNLRLENLAIRKILYQVTT